MAVRSGAQRPPSLCPWSRHGRYNLVLKNGDSTMPTWPEELLQFAFVPDPNARLADLANLCETEDWDYHNTDTHHTRPILYNYVRYTYHRLAEEKKIALSEDGEYCCFNTGLVTEAQEP